MPSTPLKKTEKRKKKWREHWGGLEQTEIDALVELYPDRLRAMTMDAIAPFYDATLAERVREVADEWREKTER